MEIMIELLAISLGLVGLLGCVLPILPGPPISYLGLFILYYWGAEDVLYDLTPRVMITWLIVTIVVTVLDYIIPAIFAKKVGGSKAASRGSIVGMLIGIIFFPPIGMIIGAFVGALVADMFVEGNDFRRSLKPAIGSFLGFLAGTGLKLIASGVMLYYMIVAAF